MPTTNQGHAAILQLVAEGMRSPAAGQLTPAQLRRMAGLLDRIAVELLVPGYEEEEDTSPLMLTVDRRAGLPLNG